VSVRGFVPGEVDVCGAGCEATGCAEGWLLPCEEACAPGGVEESAGTAPGRLGDEVNVVPPGPDPTGPVPIPEPGICLGGKLSVVAGATAPDDAGLEVATDEMPDPAIETTFPVPAPETETG